MIIRLLLLLPVAPPPIAGNYRSLTSAPQVCWDCPDMFPLEFVLAFMAMVVLLMGVPAILGDYIERRRTRKV